MRRFCVIILLGALGACGAAEPTASPQLSPTAAATKLAAAVGTPSPLPSATPRPTDLPRPTRTAKPTPSPLPTQTVPPEITAKPQELDTPTLTERNAPPTAAPEPPPNPVSDPGVPVRLTLSSIGIDAVPISVGLDPSNIPIVPKHDVGWYNLSARPGQGENVVFWGHVLRWKDSPNVPAPFAALQHASIGDRLTVTTADGSTFEYAVTEEVWVTPDQVQYILPVGSERITLVSCIGDTVIRDGNVQLSHRLITIAEPVR